MKRTEIVLKAQMLMVEIKRLEEEYGVLEQVADGPKGIFSAWPNGMPKGTNDRQMAVLQRTDVNDALDRLEVLYQELDILIEAIERMKEYEQKVGN